MTRAGTGRRGGRFVCAGLAWMMAGQVAFGATVELVRPSAADPAIGDYDRPDVVIEGARDAPLVLFLTGTGGRPQGAMRFLTAVASFGSRVIGLEYDDEPSLSQVCPQRPPGCSGRFRRMRVDGTGDGPVSNPPAESITSRLASLLRFLEREHPGAGWGAYLAADGRPAWGRIVVSGLSQGAGMAAFIAKEHETARVVLFSSPWDVTGQDRRPAPWLSDPSATPMDRWWAEFHVRENTARLIADAYAALGIPDGHVLRFDLGLPEQGAGGDNPYHGSTIRNPGYLAQWREMFGAER